MFYNCEKLESGLNSVRVTYELDMQSAFEKCVKLTSPPAIRTMYGPLNLDDTFNDCESITKIPNLIFPSSQTATNRATVSLNRTFANCISLSDYKNSIGNGLVFNNVDAYGEETFDTCTSLVRGIDVNLNREANVTFVRSYTNCKNLTNAGVYDVQRQSTLTLKETYKDVISLSYIPPLSVDSTSKIILDHTFEGCAGLTNIDAVFSNIGGKYICDHTFKDCTGLTIVSIDAQYIDSFVGMFEGCTNLSQVTFKNVPVMTRFTITHAILDNNTLSYTILFA